MQNCWKSLRFCFSPQVAESEETIRKTEMELAMSQEKHRTCTQEVKKLANESFMDNFCDSII